MIPFFEDPHLAVYRGDCRAVMAEMEPESVHMVVTSPPYYGLRDYGTATWSGGDLDHEHEVIRRWAGPKDARGSQSGHAAASDRLDRKVCSCGAERIDDQLGLEETPEAYVEAMVGVFREVRRVLRADGTVWLNLGDSYSSSATYSTTRSMHTEHGWKQDGDHRPSVSRSSGVKAKDLVGIPWRVAFALQADGWYLRRDIIWSKPNPMPESVKDRPTTSHEYLFLLTKSERYYYDGEAVREPASRATEAKWDPGTDGLGGDDRKTGRSTRRFGKPLVKVPAGWNAGESANDRLGRYSGGVQRYGDTVVPVLGRNLRSVWTIPTQPYPGAHFATFPEDLVAPCVLAGTSEFGCCPTCGSPYRRVTEKDVRPPENGSHAVRGVDPTGAGGNSLARTVEVTTGWAKGCKHVSPLRPAAAVVLDPFGGSGTTARVANRLSRRAVLIDLSTDYLDQAMVRNAQSVAGL